MAYCASMLLAGNVLIKLGLLALLLFGALSPDLPQFEGKAFGTRLVGYGLVTLVIPAVWLFVGRVRRGRPYPHWIDILVVLPFFMDTAGNAMNLYDTIAWFDDVMHFLTWVPWAMSLGLALHAAPELPRWAHGGLVVGFGAVTHILWELGEYATFIRDNPNEYRTAYTDTLGDLSLSLMGSVFAAFLVVTVFWAHGRSLRAPR